jgi:hypothetical protein
MRSLLADRLKSFDLFFTNFSCSSFTSGDRRSDLIVRFGSGSETPRSLRRAVEAVLL